jgi:hypothetical protein
LGTDHVNPFYHIGEQQMSRCKHVTVVIKYDDREKVPGFHANMKALGGTVTAVQFDDALSEMEDMQGYIDDLESQLAPTHCSA